MFTSDNASHAHSTRSKRTRQTAGNDESIKQPLTKKRRSVLRRDTFEPLAEASLNEIAGRDKGGEKLNGHTVEPPILPTQNGTHSKELTLRGVKKAEKRSERGGGQTTLSSNDFYTVTQLPSLPDQIRNHPSMPYSCIISPEYDYILALTHTDALVWPYNSSLSVPSSRDLISFKLPFPPASTNDPLPLAAFTAKSANGEPGIVAVSPKWGKVVYWENITNASSFVPGQTSSGVQGSIPGMLGGETLKELVKAEPAGFIVTFSHGRVAHLTVRDQMGRPGIGVQFLRKSAAGTVRGGIFGSIKNVFLGDRRKGTPIVRAGKSAKAQRDIIIGTEDGEFEFWKTNLSIGNSLVKSLSIKDDLYTAVQAHMPEFQASQLSVVDFHIDSTQHDSREIVKHGDRQSISLLILVAVSDSEKSQYLLAAVTVAEEMTQVREIHALKYHVDATSSSWRPKISMSKTQSLAFILFEKAILLMSLAKVKETPSSQLLMEKIGLPERFQDCLRFKDDSIYQVLGHANEELDGHTSCVLAVQGCGLVRITAHLQDNEEIDVDEVENSIGPKTKIEQAIFFGTIRNNPLELNKPVDECFASGEIELAVLQISNEIISSSSKYLPKSGPSIENHMKLRAKALADLADHISKNYAGRVSRSVRFQLLWNAEKLASAQSVWKVQEDIQRSYPHQDDREMTYLNFALRALNESRQKYPDQEKGEKDHVRHWLIHSVSKIDHLTSELTSSLRELDDMDVKDPRIICDYMMEAVDLWIATYQTAFKFREDHAVMYGLGDEVFEDGVLQTGYPVNLPQPWTSGPEPFRFGQRLIYDICTFLHEWWDYTPVPNTKIKGKKTKEMPTDLDGKPYNAPSQEQMHHLASRLPTEVELFSRITHEENIQAQANVKLVTEDPDEQKRQIAELKNEIRPRLVQAVSVISTYNAPGAIELAEKLKDPGLLVTLNRAYLLDLEKEAHLHPHEAHLIEQKKAEVQAHVETYFDKFGNSWAYAHFTGMIQHGHLGSIFGEAQANKGQKQKYLNWYLRRAEQHGQQVGKLTWINEIVGEKRYDRAQKTLEKVSAVEESDVWAKKTELCLAKLAGLAAVEGKEQKQPEPINKYDNSLAYLDLQTSLVAHISASTSDAIDVKAAQDLAVSMFAQRIVEKSPSFKRVLVAAINTVLANSTLSLTSMVNLLTLLDPVPYAGVPDEDPGIHPHEIVLALQAIDFASVATAGLSSQKFSSDELDALRMLIWRRAIIRDDWLVLNETSGKSDQQVVNEMQMSSLFKALLDVFQHHYDTPSQSASSQPLILFSPLQILDTPTLLLDSLKPHYLTSVGIEGGSVEAKRFLDGLSKEMDAEQSRLKTFVDKGQLQQHWEGMVREAERSVRAWVGLDEPAKTNGKVADGDDIVESVERDLDEQV